jgi:hypothetical protein
MVKKSKHDESEVNPKVTRVWEVVISDLKLKLIEANSRVRLIRKTIRNFERLKRDGMPWPGVK